MGQGQEEGTMVGENGKKSQGEEEERQEFSCKGRRGRGKKRSQGEEGEGQEEVSTLKGRRYQWEERDKFI